MEIIILPKGTLKQLKVIKENKMVERHVYIRNENTNLVGESEARSPWGGTPWIQKNGVGWSIRVRTRVLEETLYSL